MTKKRYTLDELLAQSEGAYPLPPEEREWVNAPAVGREIDDYDNWFREQVQIGLDSANAGNLIPAAEVEAEAAAWRAKVQEALDDTRPTVPHEQVMAEAQALIDTKKKGQGDD